MLFNLQAFLVLILLAPGPVSLATELTAFEIFEDPAPSQVTEAPTREFGPVDLAFIEVLVEIEKVRLALADAEKNSADFAQNSDEAIIETISRCESRPYFHSMLFHAFTANDWRKEKMKARRHLREKRGNKLGRTEKFSMAIANMKAAELSMNRAFLGEKNKRPPTPVTTTITELSHLLMRLPDLSWWDVANSLEIITYGAKANNKNRRENVCAVEHLHKVTKEVFSLVKKIAQEAFAAIDHGDKEHRLEEEAQVKISDQLRQEAWEKKEYQRKIAILKTMR